MHGEVVSSFEPRWFSGVKRRSEGRCRLLCLPHAGAAASTYRDWAHALPDTVEVWPIQLPGRANRALEPAFDTLPRAVAALLHAVGPLLDRPFSIFGHSMGALLAFELGRALARFGWPLPDHIFVSGRVAPSETPPGPELHRLGERDFIAAVRELGGTPDAVLDDADLMALALPTLRSDFRLAETYEYQRAPALATAITAFCGADDERAPPELSTAWARETSVRFERSVHPGGHFFVRERREEILRHVSERVR